MPAPPRLPSPAAFGGDPRVLRIFAHYSREVALGRMTPNAATRRALEDIAGQNHHPSLPQRALRADPSSQPPQAATEERGRGPLEEDQPK